MMFLEFLTELKSIHRLIMALSLMCLTLPALSEQTGHYRLGVGDTIEIKVFGEEDLSMAIRIDESNTVSYPFLGDIYLTGKSVGQIEKIISEGLRGDYLIEPEVSVSIAEYRKFFINGEVSAPGGYQFEPGLTVKKAVAMAGGFTERASQDKVLLERVVGQKVKSNKVELSEKLYPGDIVTVKASFF
jgi:polysaccharide export outer membrane protein